MDLSTLAIEYLEALEAAGKAEKTLYTYGKDLKQILDFFGGDRQLKSIKKPEVGKFLKSNELLLLPNGKQRAPQTVRKTVRVLRMMFQWAAEQGYIEEVPLPQSILKG